MEVNELAMALPPRILQVMIMILLSRRALLCTAILIPCPLVMPIPIAANLTHANRSLVPVGIPNAHPLLVLATALAAAPNIDMAIFTKGTLPKLPIILEIATPSRRPGVGPVHLLERGNVHVFLTE